MDDIADIVDDMVMRRGGGAGQEVLTQPLFVYGFPPGTGAREVAEALDRGAPPFKVAKVNVLGDKNGNPRYTQAMRADHRHAHHRLITIR